MSEGGENRTLHCSPHSIQDYREYAREYFLSHVPHNQHHSRRLRRRLFQTDAGESVLAGHANAVELNGIDDWVLGVHLDSENGSVWYRKDGALVPR